ncbi:hypothetical protein PFISCL1PPCAC_15103, partial [Pristionchus fissidentatus]
IFSTRFQLYCYCFTYKFSQMCIGPKCSGCLFFIGAWGAIFLGILGGLFYNQSVGLFEDLPAMSFNDIATLSWEERKEKIVDAYLQNAYNSWIAAAANLVMAIFALSRICCLARG